MLRINVKIACTWVGLRWKYLVWPGGSKKVQYPRGVDIITGHFFSISHYQKIPQSLGLQWLSLCGKKTSRSISLTIWALFYTDWVPWKYSPSRNSTILINVRFKVNKGPIWSFKTLSIYSYGSFNSFWHLPFPVPGWNTREWGWIFFLKSPWKKPLRKTPTLGDLFLKLSDFLAIFSIFY